MSKPIDWKLYVGGRIEVAEYEDDYAIGTRSSKMLSEYIRRELRSKRKEIALVVADAQSHQGLMDPEAWSEVEADAILKILGAGEE